MTGDVSTMGNYVHQIIDTLMTGFLMILAIAVMMFLEDWRLAADRHRADARCPSCCSSFISSQSEKHFYQMFTRVRRAELPRGGSLHELRHDQSLQP